MTQATCAPDSAAREAVVVIGVGNSLRHDDGAGPEVVRRLGPAAAAAGIAARALEGETLGLLDVWAGARAVVLVDTTRSGAPPGTIHRLDVSSQPLPGELRGSSSTHAIGVREGIELARTLGRLPRRVLLLGVEGRRFDAGTGFSREVEAALEELTQATLREARALANRSGAEA